MEKALFAGYRHYSFTDPAQNKTHKGYTLYLLQEINDKKNESSGYMPLTFYDRYNNRQKYPSVSEEDFEKFELKDLEFGAIIEITFDRYNHLIDVNYYYE